MPNKLFKVLSIIVAMLPSCFAWLLPSKIDVYYKITSFIIISFIISGLFYYLINKAKNFGYDKIKPTKVIPINREMLLFLVSSFLPVLAIFSNQNLIQDFPHAGFLILFALVMLSVVFLSDSYYCSPLFAIFCYNMYQVELKGIVFLLITRKNITTLEEAEMDVVSLTSHIFLDRN